MPRLRISGNRLSMPRGLRNDKHGEERSQQTQTFKYFNVFTFFSVIGESEVDHNGVDNIIGSGRNKGADEAFSRGKLVGVRARINRAKGQTIVLEAGNAEQVER